MNPKRRPLLVLDFLVLLLALAGFGINLLLLVRRFSSPSAWIAGCGGGSCEEVLASRWAVIFGVPVTVFGVAAYSLFMVSMTEGAGRLREPLLGVIAGASAWFVFVQAVFLGKFCPWCMAAHGVGAAVVVLGMIRHRATGSPAGIATGAITTFLSIGLAQVYGPVPASHRMEDLPVRSEPARTVVREGRKINFEGVGRTYDVSGLPLLGSARAKHILVEYFDYQCPSCRTMSGFLEAFAGRHPADVAFLLLPVPMDGACNGYVTASGNHPGSCSISRIALAVWKEKPEMFPSFHHSLMADPSVASARRIASGIVPADRLDAGLTAPWIDALLQANIADWREFSKSNDKLPKLLVRDKRILHGLPSGEEDFIRVMEKELGIH